MTAHKEILVDFDDAETNAFMENFVKDVSTFCIIVLLTL